jgi:hypothetical protein
MAFHNKNDSMEILYLCGISHLRLITVGDLKTAVRDCFNDFQPSTWMMSRRTWGGIKICAESRGKHTNNF